MEFFAGDERDSIVSIRDFSNKVIYVNFWATWCGPCIKNVPELNKVIDQYAADNRIVFVNVCLGSEKDQWKRSMDKTGIKGINLFAEKNWTAKLMAEFSMQGFPTYVLLDKDNRLYENHTDKAPMVSKKIVKLLELHPR